MDFHFSLEIAGKLRVQRLRPFPQPQCSCAKKEGSPRGSWVNIEDAGYTHPPSGNIQSWARGELQRRRRKPAREEGWLPLHPKTSRAVPTLIAPRNRCQLTLTVATTSLHPKRSNSSVVPLSQRQGAEAPRSPVSSIQRSPVLLPSPKKTRGRGKGSSRRIRTSHPRVCLTPWSTETKNKTKSHHGHQNSWATITGSQHGSMLRFPACSAPIWEP